MKYLKRTLILFVIAFAFSAFNAKAQVVAIQNVTIKSFKGIWTSSKTYEKTTTVEQRVKKTSCWDNVTGDGRVILGRGNANSAGIVSDWVEVPYSFNYMGSRSKTIAFWSLQLQSNKSLLTTATFYGVWSTD